MGVCMVLSFVVASAVCLPPEYADVLESDDMCHGDSLSCAMSLAQLRATRTHGYSSSSAGRDLPARESPEALSLAADVALAVSTSAAQRIEAKLRLSANAVPASIYAAQLASVPGPPQAVLMAQQSPPVDSMPPGGREVGEAVPDASPSAWGQALGALRLNDELFGADPPPAATRELPWATGAAREAERAIFPAPSAVLLEEPGPPETDGAKAEDSRANKEALTKRAVTADVETAEAERTKAETATLGTEEETEMKVETQGFEKENYQKKVLQADNSQTEDSQTEDSQLEDLQTENSQTDDSQTGDSKEGELKIEDSQAENSHTEDSWMQDSEVAQEGAIESTEKASSESSSTVRQSHADEEPSTKHRRHSRSASDVNAETGFTETSAGVERAHFFGKLDHTNLHPSDSVESGNRSLIGRAVGFANRLQLFNSHPAWLKDCKHILLDIGSGNGSNIKALYEPEIRSFSSKLLRPLQQVFKTPESRRQPSSVSGICALGLEPNPAFHSALHRLKRGYKARGWHVHFYPLAAWSSSTLLPMRDGLLLPSASEHEGSGSEASPAGATNTVRAVDLAEFVHSIPESIGVAMMLMDIDGAEYEALSSLIGQNALCQSVTRTALVAAYPTGDLTHWGNASLSKYTERTFKHILKRTKIQDCHGPTTSIMDFEEFAPESR